MGRFSNANFVEAKPAAPVRRDVPQHPAASKAPASDTESAGPSHTLGLLDAKIRVHNRLIDELDLSAVSYTHLTLPTTPYV